MGGQRCDGALFPANFHSDVEAVAKFTAKPLWFIAADATWPGNGISTSNEEW